MIAGDALSLDRSAHEVHRATATAAVLALVIWGASAVALTWHGLPPRVAPPVIVALLVIAQLAAIAMLPRLRSLLATVDPRVLVVPHGVRLVGLWFLVLWRRGELPFGFAVPGGTGDLLVAIGAFAVAWAAIPVITRTRRVAFIAWNVLGLLDLTVVVTTAMHFARAAPASLEPLRHLPLVLLPTFAVPLLIVSHLVLLVRLGSRTSSTHDRGQTPHDWGRRRASFARREGAARAGSAGERSGRADH